MSRLRGSTDRQDKPPPYEHNPHEGLWAYFKPKKKKPTALEHPKPFKPKKRKAYPPES